MNVVHHQHGRAADVKVLHHGLEILGNRFGSVRPLFNKSDSVTELVHGCPSNIRCLPSRPRSQKRRLSDT